MEPEDLMENISLLWLFDWIKIRDGKEQSKLKERKKTSDSKIEKQNTIKIRKKRLTTNRRKTKNKIENVKMGKK